jgi:hypothetical protein
MGDSALAAPSPHLDLGMGLSAARGGAGAGAVLRLGLPLGAWEGSFVGREGLMGGPARSIGSLAFGASRAFGEGAWAGRAAFLHHHETGLVELRAAPLASFAGTAEGINHRSGLELGLSRRQPLAAGALVVELWGDLLSPAPSLPLASGGLDLAWELPPLPVQR